MKTGGIDSSQIQAMIAQLKAAAASPQMQSLMPPGLAASAQGTGAVGGATAAGTAAATPAAKVDFSAALKASLDAVNASQTSADTMGQKFSMGDDSVSLSDVMIAQQKASINFQATVQVRNKLISAYHDIMNMQV